MTRSRRSRVTMSDVARVSGVSLTTVSHVVNQTRAVSARAEEAVVAAIAQLGYMSGDANGATTRIVGLALSALSNPSFNGLIHTVERAVTQRGYSLLLTDTHDDPAVELRAVTSLLDRRVEAILLAPSIDPSRSLRYAADQAIPTVLVDRMLAVDVDQVGSENIEATALLVDHLAGHGHRKIAMISGQPGLSTTAERVEGFRLGARRNSIRVVDDQIVTGQGSDRRAEDAFARVLQASEPPTAIVIGNNRMALGAMRAARALQISIPGRIAIVCYDDFEWADLVNPSLTVIAQPIQAIGEQAVDLALSRLENPTRPARKVVLQPRFVCRESCGCVSHQ